MTDQSQPLTTTNHVDTDTFAHGFRFLLSKDEMMAVQKALKEMPRTQRELYQEAIHQTCSLNQEIFTQIIEGHDSLMFKALHIHRETVTFLKKYLESEYMNYTVEIVYVHCPYSDGCVNCHIRVEWGDTQSRLKKEMGVE